MSAPTDYNPWGVAWEIDKAAVRVGKKVGKGGYRMAQNAGMRYQNWKHKGAGDGGVQVGGTIEVPSTAAARKGSGKNWTTDEERLENTTTSHTTYTRKRTR